MIRLIKKNEIENNIQNVSVNFIKNQLVNSLKFGYCSRCSLLSYEWQKVNNGTVHECQMTEFSIILTK